MQTFKNFLKKFRQKNVLKSVFILDSLFQKASLFLFNTSTFW
jgi:hypothetical protein